MNKYIVLDGVTQEFLSRLRELRQSLGLTQNEASSALGIHKDLLRLYEEGRRIPFFVTIFQGALTTSFITVK